MVASINSVSLGQSETIKTKGLADHHTYTVLHALTVFDENDQFLRIVKIRNPYGSRAKREW